MNGKEEKINKHAKLIRRRHFPFHFFLYINIKARGRKILKKNWQETEIRQKRRLQDKLNQYSTFFGS